MDLGSDLDMARPDCEFENTALRGMRTRTGGELENRKPAVGKRPIKPIHERA